MLETAAVLIRLAISNLATIESLVLELPGGFTVLTGETGAGKSILLDAIRFVMGGRPSPEKVRTGTRQTLVEAAFDVSGQPDVLELLSRLGIPCQGELTVRRAMGENGRSRSLANDCSITQGALEELGDYLVNIHGQHDNQRLLNPATHLEFLDSFGGLDEPRKQVRETFLQYTGLLKERADREKANRERQAERESLIAAVEEIGRAELAVGESAALKAELARLTHAEKLFGLTGQVLRHLYEGEAPVLGAMRDIKRCLDEAAGIDPRLEDQAGQLEPLLYQLEDLHRGVLDYNAKMEAEPERLEQVNERLALLEKILRRHGPTEEEALEKLARAGRELQALDSGEEQLRELGEEISRVARRLHDLSLDLSGRRKEAAGRLDAMVVEQLRELGMNKAEFSTAIEPLASPAGVSPYYTATGADRVEFLLNTNPGQKIRPLAKTASGGELSRTMLALKTVLAREDPTATLIFDEVDSGISGKTAEIVGRKLSNLAQSHQVLCVTHLPQIAALGNNHMRVSKDTSSGAAYTSVERLGETEQVLEVARLLSGMEISEHSLASAREMVGRGRKPQAG
ncbi:MAG: DNA repair protein RecN [Deltaproteobacteria bacterium]|nr:DNA repair protein RecN [Deltaproteobacteria bacterium]